MPPPPPDESPVAIVLDGVAQAVLMATPQDLQDFATGFAVTERLIDDPADITGFEAAQVSVQGRPAWEARLWLRPGLAVRAAGRRAAAAPVGCGLCGVDSLEQALPDVVPVASDLTLTPAELLAGFAALEQGQVLRLKTPAIHGACLWRPDGPALLREDVGRHNALDKLAGAALRDGTDPTRAVVVISSRLSVDLVQKCARIGVPVLAGAGAPTRMGLEWAKAAGITLIGRLRADGFDLYAHPERLT